MAKTKLSEQVVPTPQLCFPHLLNLLFHAQALFLELRNSPFHVINHNAAMCGSCFSVQTISGKSKIPT
jgi:hypothetical protein